jgi:arylsulfatase A-like enzyme
MNPAKTNILFITSDQQHWSAMGYLNPEVKTPNLDRLVRRGTTFHRAYTVNPTCTPTRASWITGLYPSQHGAYSLGTKLMESVPTIGDVLNAHDYRTALVGKAHFQPLKGTEEYPSLESYPILQDLDYWRGFHGPFYGFSHVELARNHTDESHVGQHYALWMEEKGHKDWSKYFIPQQGPLRPGQAWSIPEEIHYDTWIAERTNALMEDFHRKGENFFLWASFFDPHPKYMAPEPFASMYDPDSVTVPEFREGEFDDKPPHFGMAREEKPDFSVYHEPEGNVIHGAQSHLRSREARAKNIAMMYGMVTMMDKYIGKILDKLDELGLTESTLVCFTTDHGDFWGQHGLVAKAIHHYEDMVRVPLVVAQPGVVPEGVVSESLQSTVDLAQTFLSFAGLPVPRAMTGVDEKPVWTGKVPKLRDHVIVENQHQPTLMNMRTYIEKRHKMTVHFNRPYGELYDLEADPGEFVNLWDKPECQDLKRDMLLRFIYADMARAPRPMPRIAAA